MVVMGMGITGRSVAVALQTRGADIVALDDRVSEDLLAWADERDLSVEATDTVDLTEVLNGAEALFPTPGLPDHHPIFEVAAKASVPVRSLSLIHI